MRVGEIHASRNDIQSANIWAAPSPREKEDVLRRLVEQNVARVLPAVLGKGLRLGAVVDVVRLLAISALLRLRPGQVVRPSQAMRRRPQACGRR